MTEAFNVDHRQLGRELDLFVFSELVGPGLPLWTPRGTRLRDRLDNFVWELRQRYGYERVDIPHLAKPALYQTSGHWDKFADELFKVQSREGREFALKPMNCPHHVEIFRRRPWSYRDLPQRYATTTKMYRDEQTGELGGLTRVRAITIDDAHVFCRHQDSDREIKNIWQIIKDFYAAFGLPVKTVRLSLHDPQAREKYLGTPEQWQKAESDLRIIAKAEGVKTIEAPGEAAFYGPKVDFLIEDSLGREWQAATIQLDFNLPERFDLTAVNETGQPERLVMIHAAIMGSLERFLALLLEHTGGHLPLWLAPSQAAVLTVTDKNLPFAQQVFDELQAAKLDVVASFDNETLGKKIKTAKLQKIPYLIIIGDQESASGQLTVEGRAEKITGISINNLITRLDTEITSKK